MLLVRVAKCKVARAEWDYWKYAEPGCAPRGHYPAKITGIPEKSGPPQWCRFVLAQSDNIMIPVKRNDRNAEQSLPNCEWTRLIDSVSGGRMPWP